MCPVLSTWQPLIGNMVTVCKVLGCADNTVYYLPSLESICMTALSSSCTLQAVARLHHCGVHHGTYLSVPNIVGFSHCFYGECCGVPSIHAEHSWCFLQSERDALRPERDRMAADCTKWELKASNYQVRAGRNKAAKDCLRREVDSLKERMRVLHQQRLDLEADRDDILQVEVSWPLLCYSLPATLVSC